MSAEAKPKYDVFISYQSHDTQLAHAACSVLEGHRIRCWIAPRDIAPGTEWGAAIIGGIDSCRIMVLIFSTHANESGQVRREVERAISKELPILPVRVEDVRPTGAMEYALSNRHWLDAFTPPVEAHLETISASVQVLLAIHSSKTGEDAAPGQSVKSQVAKSANAMQTAVSNTAERAVILIDLGYTLYAFGLAKETLSDEESNIERGRRELGDLFDRLGIAFPKCEPGHEMFRVTRRGLLTEQERECLDMGMRIGAIFSIGMVIIIHKGTDYEQQAIKALSEKTREMQISLQSLGILESIERKQALRKILSPDVRTSADTYSQHLDWLKASIKAELRRQFRDVSHPSLASGERPLDTVPPSKPWWKFW